MNGEVIVNFCNCHLSDQFDLYATYFLLTNMRHTLTWDLKKGTFRHNSWLLLYNELYISSVLCSDAKLTMNSMYLNVFILDTSYEGFSHLIVTIPICPIPSHFIFLWFMPMNQSTIKLKYTVIYDMTYNWKFWIKFSQLEAIFSETFVVIFYFLLCAYCINNSS